MLHLIIMAGAIAYVAKTRISTSSESSNLLATNLESSHAEYLQLLQKLNTEYSETLAAREPIKILVDFVKPRLEQQSPFNHSLDAVDGLFPEPIRKQFARALLYKHYIARVGLYNKALGIVKLLDDANNLQLVAWLSQHVRILEQLNEHLYFERGVVSYAECESFIAQTIASDATNRDKLEQIEALQSIISVIEKLISEYSDTVMQIARSDEHDTLVAQQNLERNLHSLEITAKEFKRILSSGQRMSECRNDIQAILATLEDCTDHQQIVQLKRELASTRSLLILSAMQYYLFELINNFMLKESKPSDFLTNAIFACYVPLLDTFSRMHTMRFEDLERSPESLTIPTAVIKDLQHAINLFGIQFPDHARIFMGCVNEQGHPINMPAPSSSITPQYQNHLERQLPPPIPPRPNLTRTSRAAFKG